MTTERKQHLIGLALELTSSLVPVVPLRPGKKNPLPNDEGRMEVIVDPDVVEPRLNELARKHGDINLAMYVGRSLDGKVASPIAAISFDTYAKNGPRGVAKARELGISKYDPTWIARTGRGGIVHFFFAPGDYGLKRQTPVEGLDIDLLVRGPAAIPPSDSSHHADGGGPYSWVNGHSPLDIPVSDLQALPTTVLSWWLSVQQPEPFFNGSSNGSDVSRLFVGPIAQNSRNDTLTSIAGSLFAHNPPDVATQLLLSLNQSHCSPPLPEREVLLIARSIGGREGRKPAKAWGSAPQKIFGLEHFDIDEPNA